MDGTKDMTIRTYGTSGLPQAHTPDPENLATNVKINTDLDWVSGIDVITHEVYFDSVESNVLNRLVTPVVVTEPVSSCMPPIS